MRQNRWGASNLVVSPPVIVAQIETKKGVNNLQEIKKYGFDYYMIGPYDLSASMGVPAQFDSEEYLNAVARVRKLIPSNQMAVHIPTDVQNQIKKYDGYGIIAVGMDTIALLEGYEKWTF